MLRKLKWQILGEPLAARNNWYQNPVPGRGPAVEIHWFRVLLPLTIFVPATGYPRRCSKGCSYAGYNKVFASSGKWINWEQDIVVLLRQNLLQKLIGLCGLFLPYFKVTASLSAPVQLAEQQRFLYKFWRHSGYLPKYACSYLPTFLLNSMH